MLLFILFFLKIFKLTVLYFSMGLFDFFRKITEKKIEEPKILLEKIAFSEIGNWIERKRKDVEISEKEIFFSVQEKINVFTNELEGKINILKDVDIGQKKAEDRINYAVNESRKKYIESLRDLIENLEGLKKDGLDKFIRDINKIFLDFNKSSYKSYERTTILIGKEMANLKNNLKVFSGDLIKLFNENKNIVDSFNEISLIKLNLKQVEDIEKNFKMINKKIIFLGKAINEKESEKKKILEEIEKIKKSEDYIKNLEIHERIKLFEGELEKDILSLKQVIDFKALANFFHIFEEQMSVVKDHRDNFQTSFRKDDGESIIGLLNESKLNNETISGKIRRINNKKEEIMKNKREIKKNKTKELYFEIIKIIQKIDELKNEKSIGEKRYLKIKTNRKELIDMVREEVEKMGVKIEV